MGFPAFEMWPHRGKDIDAIAALSKDLGIECAQFTAWGFSPGMNDAKNHEAVEKEIEIDVCPCCRGAWFDGGELCRERKGTVVHGSRR